MSKSQSAKEKAISRFLAKKSVPVTPQNILEGIKSGDIQFLAKAITLLESTQKEDVKTAAEVVRLCLPLSGNSIRIGITGVPGVGKSTFIEALGLHLTQQGIKTAILAIDPSSNRTKGSILGDKTRMEQLSVEPLAFIRPSPSSGTLGGVANATRESILLCEAAGYEVIIVETVGVGQSEYLVKEMVDFFLLLMLSGAGDEIQGIKRGIMEMADGLFVNKADGKNEVPAQKAAQAYRNALHLFPPRADNWIPKTGTCSALNQNGVSEIWETIQAFKAHQQENLWWVKNRKQQSKTWLHDQINHRLKHQFFNHPSVKQHFNSIEEEVESGNITPLSGAKELLNLFLNEPKTTD